MNVKWTTYCEIENGTVILDGTDVFSTSEENPLKEIFKSLEISYGKFYKMDNLSKLGILGVEFLKQSNEKLNVSDDDQIAVVLQNEHSCLESDVKHQASLDKKMPSPAIFVYTLPNIVIGEISIRNKWFGESAFFIDRADQIDHLVSYSKSLILTGKATICICGIVESFENEQFLKLAVLEKTDEDVELQAFNSIFGKSE